jgi:hypothetical protein
MVELRVSFFTPLLVLGLCSVFVVLGNSVNFSIDHTCNPPIEA